MDEEQNIGSTELNLGEVDQSYLDQKIQAHEARSEIQEQAKTLELQAQQQEQEQLDPANDIGDYIRDTAVGVAGGLQDTVSSLVTAPERVIDAFTGEMGREAKTEEGYRTEWDDWLVDDENPIETKTWWGGIIRGITHFGTLAYATGGVGAAASKAAGATALGKGYTTLMAGKKVLPSLARGAGVGARLDLFSKYSQEDNALGMLTQRYGFLDTPISTKADDHPAMKTLKNVVEGMGIGLVFDGARLALGASWDKVAARNKSVLDQSKEMAVEQLELPGFGGYKNKDFADNWQGAPTSREKAGNVFRSRQKQLNEWGAEMGSPGSTTTPASLRRWVKSSRMGEQELENLARELLSDSQYNRVIAETQAGRLSLNDTWGRALEMAQRTIEGRNTSNLTPDEFWTEYFQQHELLRVDPETAIPVWAAKNIAASDLVIGSLMREIRDMGYAGRELFEIADLAAVDAPAAAVRDKILVGLTEIKRSKLAHSDTFRGLGAGPQAKQAFDTTLDQQVKESTEALDMALKYATDDVDDDMFKALFETISMVDDVHNLTDLDNWMRKKLKGGEFNGKPKTGLLIKELQGVMVNSILSGPKTAMRAIMGTSTATFLRPISTAMGAAIRAPFTGDGTTVRASLAAVNAMRESIPEAWTLFKTKLNSYWAGDISTVRSRFSEYTKNDEQWKLLGHWIENSGRATDGDKAAYRIANIARSLNDNKYLTYSTKIMAATDDTFGYILGRARAREKAVFEALENSNPGAYTDINPNTLKQAEERFLGQIMDSDGNILDSATEFAKREATLTQDLTGFSKGLQDTFEKAPWAKPFFLFARTGVNGLTLTAKHTPGFNFLVKEFNDIAFATPETIQNVAKYGIESPQDLINAKALQTGRLAIGSAVMMMATGHFMNGGLTGNGPTDRQKRQVWIDAGWQPRSINIGGVWVGYDSMEPFNQILSTIADVGDHSQLMGEEWTQDQFQKMALVIAQSAASKSYLQGVQQFVDLFAGRPGQQNRIIGGLLNNTVPLGGLRNEIGKLFNPHMKELGSGIGDAIRNRNLVTEAIAGDPLPSKYDMLNGQPIKDYNFITRMYNMFSPISLNLDHGPGRKLLFDSGYDLRLSTYYGPDGTDLTDAPELRSKFQQYIGQQNVERELNKLARDPKVIASIRRMQADLNAGRRELDPMKSYLHNKLIRRIFSKARKRAWAQMKNDSGVRQLMRQELELKNLEKDTLRATTPLLQMNK